MIRSGWIGKVAALLRLPLPVGLLLLVRVMLLMSTTPETLRGFGDLPHFWGWTSLAGLPYIHYWVEFPPVFPYLSELLGWLAGGQEHVYDTLLVAVLALADAGSLAAFLRIAEKVGIESGGEWRAWSYFAFLAALPYTWWYFDPLAVLALLLAIEVVLEERSVRGGLLVGLGILLKLFPALILPAVWRRYPWRKALMMSAAAGLAATIVYGGLFLVSPRQTAASLVVQANKGSWETVWALVDGNLMTGNVVSQPAERLDPAAASLSHRSTAVIPTWLTLLVFGGLGLAAFFTSRVTDGRGLIAFAGLTFALFLSWSPGWSPQWVLYLLPVILLCLPKPRALLLAVALVLTNLLEWPVLLSRWRFDGLWLTAPVRALLLLLLAWSCYEVVRRVKA